jgi:predicted 3-demethylubiquinone-9 3-methyltransferase (glyoxalase superfamily)
VLPVRFQLHGQEFLALNGGPQCMCTEAVSFIVHCETQEELDRRWEKLAEGGGAGQCGWLKDQYGLSWQIVPTVLPTMLSDPDPARAGSVLQAVMRM